MMKSRVRWRDQLTDLKVALAKSHKVKNHRLLNYRRKIVARIKSRKPIEHLYIRQHTETLHPEALSVQKISSILYYGRIRHHHPPSPAPKDHLPSSQMYCQPLNHSKFPRRGRTYLRHMIRRMKLLPHSKEICKLHYYI